MFGLWERLTKVESCRLGAPHCAAGLVWFLIIILFVLLGLGECGRVPAGIKMRMRLEAALEKARLHQRS